MEQEYAYFPGCSLGSTAADYDQSIKTTFKKLDVKLTELKDWNCCGATPAHQTNRYLATALPLRNVAKAEAMNLDMVIPCAACFSRSKFAIRAIEKDEKFREKILDAVGLPYTGKNKVKNVISVLVEDIGLDKIKGRVKKKLEGLKVACYYGCLFTRPPEVAEADDAEQPQQMENIIRSLGGKPVDWGCKTECCGASFAIARSETMLRLTKEILEDAKANEADCIAVGCPLCHVNLDMRQGQINSKYKTSFNIPIFYITEIVAIGLGALPSELKLSTHFTDVLKLLKEKELARG